MNWNRKPGGLARRALETLELRHGAQCRALEAQGSPAARDALGKPLLCITAEAWR